MSERETVLVDAVTVGAVVGASSGRLMESSTNAIGALSVRYVRYMTISSTDAAVIEIFTLPRAIPLGSFAPASIFTSLTEMRAAENAVDLV